MTSLVRQIARDTRFYFHLRHPGRQANPLFLLLTFFSSRGLWLLISHRIGHFCYQNSARRNWVWWIARLLQGVGQYRNAALSKSELREDCHVEGAVYLPDIGYLICGAHRIGEGTIIHDHVTFGYAVGGGSEGRPIVGANVWIGPGCIIAGDLTVGDGCTLLPGTCLTYSVPPGSVVRGNPSRIIQSSFDNSSLRQSLAVVESLPSGGA